MMNRFFTLLLFASCLTAVGQEQSVFLDGEDDYINVFTPLESNNFSFSVEVKMTELPSSGVYILDTRLDDQRGYYMWIRQEGLTDFGWENGQDNFSVVQVSLADVDWFNSWQEITIVQTGSALSLFVEGELKAVLDGYLDAIASSDRIILGRRNDGPGHDFHGLMDNVFVGSGMLSVADIQLAKCNGNGDGLGAGFWNLDNGATNSVGTNAEAYIQLENGAAFVDFDSSEVDCLCADVSACNYSSSSTTNDNCDYTCCPGPGCCLDGQHWDWELNGCVITNPSDSNFDGCVQLNDLLDLLGAYGNCGAEEWHCGDPLEYQGYDYETVQIGEQCWFAENLRAENYSNGAPIQTNLSSNEWVVSTEGASAVYGESGSCEDSAPDFDACDSSIALATYGRLYNWYAVDDGRSVCPSEWHVPTDNEWMNLEIEIGMTEEEAMQTNCRGDVQGNFLKTTTGWNGGGNGTNAFGFSANPVGYRDQNGQFQDGGDEGHWWTSDSTNQSNAWYRGIGSWIGGICRNPNPKNFGFAVRCIKDIE